MNLSVVCVLVAALLGPSAPPEGVLRLSMAESVRRALSLSEEVKAASLELEKAEGQVQEARAAALPQLEASVGFTKLSGIEAMFPTGGLFPVPPSLADKDRYYQAGLMLTQLVYQGGAVRAALRAARINLKRGGVELEQARQGTIYAVKASYAAALLQRALLEVAGEAIELAGRHLKDTEARRRAGAVTDFEVLQAKVRLQGAKTGEIQARTAYELAREALLRRIGLEMDRPVELTDELEYHEFPLQELEGLLEQAGIARPDLRSLGLLADMQEVAVRVASASRKPSLVLQGNYSGSGLDDWFHEDFQYNWTLALMLRIPIFDGLQARGRRRQEAAGLEQLRYRRESLLKDMESEIRSALRRLRAARNAVESQRANVELAREAVRQAEARYKSGVLTETVLEEARLALTQARTGHVRSIHEHVMAELDLRRACGALDVPEGAEISE